MAGKKDPNEKNISATDEFERAIHTSDAHEYILRLYVSGMTPRSQKAIENIRKILEENLKGRYELDVIDIYQQPERASEAQVIAAPTLIKSLPPPVRKLIGDMSDEERVLVGLDIQVKK